MVFKNNFEVPGLFLLGFVGSGVSKRVKSRWMISICYGKFTEFCTAAEFPYSNCQYGQIYPCKCHFG